MPFPSHADYDLAVKYMGRFVFDPVLKGGTPRSRNRIAVGKGGEPLCYPGGFAKVYVVDCPSKTYALRVWLHEISDAAKRYHAITQFLKTHPLPFFVDHFEFVSSGILAGEKRYPILRMEWVEGYSLRDFIKLNLKQPAVLRAAADSFAAMVAELHANRIAHGDLQSENLLLRAKNGTVCYKLIDYDTLVVPTLLGQPTASTGLPSYQHPKRAASVNATEKDDYFSELVIYLCLYAVAENPRLWEEYPASGRDKELLFEASDFSGSAPSPLFQQLYQIGGKVAQLAVILWNYTRCPNIHLLLPLEKTVELSDQAEAEPDTELPAIRARSTFDNLLKQKLSEGKAGQNGPPNSWLDDSAFRSRQTQVRIPNTRSTPARQSTPPTRYPPADAPQPPPPSSGSSSATKGANFQQALARMRSVTATPAAIPPLPTASGSSASTRKGDASGWAIGIGIVAALFVVTVLLGKLEHVGTVAPRATPAEKGVPAVKERRSERDVDEISIEAPKAKTSEEPFAFPPSKAPVSPAIERRKDDIRNRAEEQFRAGRDHAQHERFSEAAAAYREAVILDPLHAGAWHNLGWVLAKLGHNYGAIDALKTTVKLQPESKEAWHNLVVFNARMNDIEKTSDALIHLRRLDQDRAQALTGQFSVDFVQKLAMAEYPSLGVAGSPLNREFVRRYYVYRASTPNYFQYNDWPMSLAQESAKAIGQ